MKLDILRENLYVAADVRLHSSRLRSRPPSRVRAHSVDVAVCSPAAGCGCALRVGVRGKFMDPTRFDGLARGLAGLNTRRGTLGGLLGGLLLPLLPDGESDARKKRRGNDRDGHKGRGNDGNHRDAHGGKPHQDAGHLSAEKKKKKKKCKAPTVKCGKTCKNVSTDPANCGACGRACVTGQSCQGGVCTCNGAACTGCCDGTTCQAGTTDQRCGKSGGVCTTCAGGRTCQGGVCACPAGQEICNDVCVDKQTSQDHCGTCGHACPTNTTCDGGVCTCGDGDACPDGETCCGGACRNLQNSTVACGDCATTCAADKANQCDKGACQCGNTAACGATQTCCGGTCKTTGTDFSNCGACGSACNIQTANQCVGGSCKCGSNPACGNGQRCCNGVCRDITQDTSNCGACFTTCNPTVANICSNGVCKCGNNPQCATGQTCCNGTCRTLATDFNFCGTCTNPCSSLTANQCAGGVCKCGNFAACGAGQRCCNGTCRTIASDPSNCGGCGNVCPGGSATHSAGTCSNSTCGMTCSGDYYDVNGNTADGCEKAGTGGYHSESTAYYLGELSCSDSSTGGFDGVIHSDKRAHITPTVEGFNATSGATPQWWRVFATGGACSNDPSISFSIGGTPNCYKLTFKTNKNTWTTMANPSTGYITLGSGSYDDGTSVYFAVEKVCQTTTGESAAYSVRFHL